MRSTRAGIAPWVHILVSAIAVVEDCPKSEAPECIHRHSTRVLEGSFVRSSIPLERMKAEETLKM